MSRLGNGGVVVPTLEVSAIVRRTLTRLPADEGQAILAGRLAHIATIALDGAHRRLNRVLRDHPVALRADDADRVLLSCGTWAELEDVTHLPASTNWAKQMVSAHVEATGDDLDETERHTLARRLYRFGCGFFDGLLDQSTAPAAPGATA